MKKSVVSLFAGIIALATIQITKADTLAQWTFESLTLSPSLTNATSAFGIAADVGSGTASSLHASALTVFSTPVGNGSTKSFSANNWAVNDYIQFSIATTGYEDIFLGWAQTSSSTGPGEFTLAYQVNGGGFTDFLNYTVLPNQAAAPGLGAWNGTTEITGYNYSIDLSALTALDNAASVDFRLYMRTTADSTPPGTVATAGSSRVDNVLVSATAVPEPTTLALATLGGLAGLVAMRRKR